MGSVVLLRLSVSSILVVIVLGGGRGFFLLGLAGGLRDLVLLQ